MNSTNLYLTSKGLQQPTATDLTNGVTGTGQIVLANNPVLNSAILEGILTVAKITSAIGLTISQTGNPGMLIEDTAGAGLELKTSGESPVYNITSVDNAVGSPPSTTTYHGTFPILDLGNGINLVSFSITGFTNPRNNSGPPFNADFFFVVSSTATTLVLDNPNGVAETHAATATGSGLGILIQNNNGTASPGVVILDTNGDGIVLGSSSPGNSNGVSIFDSGTGDEAAGLQLQSASLISTTSSGPFGTSMTDAGAGITLTSNGTTYTLTAADNTFGGNTVYHGTFPPYSLPTAGIFNVTISGFVNPANNGFFSVVSNTSTTLTVNNSTGVAEIHAGAALVGGYISIVNTGAGAPNSGDGNGTVIADSGGHGVGIFDLAGGGIEILSVGGPGLVSITAGGLDGSVSINNAAGTGGITTSNSATGGTQISDLGGGGISISANGGTLAVTSFIKTANAGGLGTQVNDTGGNGITVSADSSVSPVFVVTSVSTSVGNLATYHGTFPSFAFAFLNGLVTFSGFTNQVNNGTYDVQSATPTTVVVDNSHAVAETIAATMTFASFVELLNNGPGGTYITDNGGDGVTVTVNPVDPISSPGTIGIVNLFNLGWFGTEIEDDGGGGILITATQTNTYSYTVTSVDNASFGLTVYHGTFPNTPMGDFYVTISGFGHPGNNGTFLVADSTSLTMTLHNPAGIAETAAALATEASYILIENDGVGGTKILDLGGGNIVVDATGSETGSPPGVPAILALNPSGRQVTVGVPVTSLNPTLQAVFSIAQPELWTNVIANGTIQVGSGVLAQGAVDSYAAAQVCAASQTYRDNVSVNSIGYLFDTYVDVDATHSNSGSEDLGVVADMFVIGAGTIASASTGGNNISVSAGHVTAAFSHYAEGGTDFAGTGTIGELHLYDAAASGVTGSITTVHGFHANSMTSTTPTNAVAFYSADQGTGYAVWTDGGPSVFKVSPALVPNAAGIFIEVATPFSGDGAAMYIGPNFLGNPDPWDFEEEYLFYALNVYATASVGGIKVGTLDGIGILANTQFTGASESGVGLIVTAASSGAAGVQSVTGANVSASNAGGVAIQRVVGMELAVGGGTTAINEFARVLDITGTGTNNAVLTEGICIQRLDTLALTPGSSYALHILEQFNSGWAIVTEGLSPSKFNGDVQFTGFGTSIVTKTSSYITTPQDFTINGLTSGTIEITLTTTGIFIGQIFRVKNIGTGSVLVQSESFGSPAYIPTIDNAPNFTLVTPMSSGDFQWDGANWWVY